MTRRSVEPPQDIRQVPGTIPAKPRSKFSSLSSLIVLPLEFVEHVDRHVCCWWCRNCDAIDTALYIVDKSMN